MKKEETLGILTAVILVCILIIFLVICIFVVKSWNIIEPKIQDKFEAKCLLDNVEPDNKIKELIEKYIKE